MCRLGHKKSRKGCIACKRRRVKCDEQTPCRNCVRRGEQCSLLVPSPSSSSEKNGALPSTTEEWMEDLRLMRHFVRTARLEPFGTRKEVGRLWQDTVSEEAAKYPLYSYADNGLQHSLMHGLLALSALHIVHLRPAESEKHLRSCDNHQSKALEMFRSVLSSDLTEEMAVPMFALASVISISSIARSSATAMVMPEPRHVSIDQVAELFLLTRGVRDVVLVCHKWIHSGPLGGMLSGYEIPQEDRSPLPPTISARFADLERMLSHSCSDENELKVCKESLELLESVYRAVAHYDAKEQLETGHVFSWMTAVPTEFVALIQAYVPPALVVLAHFASVLPAVRSAWYTRNWGAYCLQGITIALRGTEAQQWLEWPKAHAESNMALLTPGKTDESSPTL